MARQQVFYPWASNRLRRYLSPFPTGLKDNNVLWVEKIMLNFQNCVQLTEKPEKKLGSPKRARFRLNASKKTRPMHFHPR
ncbi:TPA: hypothetical protein ACG0BA_000975 [Serratia odorifera]